MNDYLLENVEMSRNAFPRVRFNVQVSQHTCVLRDSN